MAQHIQTAAGIIPGDAAKRMLSAGSSTRYEALSQPPRPGSWDAAYWAAVSRLMRALAPLSEGMRIGYRYGFDSGEMLDYVYENRARGRFGVGRLLDRIYLDAAGWRGIRQRKMHLQDVLRATIEGLRPAHQSLHVVDVAAGPGRYLLEVLAESTDGIQATLRDWDEAGLTQGRTLAQQLGVSNVRYVRGDAFDPDDLARISPPPQIVIVSGLYELFPDNALIRRSLRGIYDLLTPGGRLVYTNQPTHPQLEFIARCLPNRDGKPWVMRLRSQEEMDVLVADAGFQHRTTLVDRWGIFTVSVADKPSQG